MKEIDVYLEQKRIDALQILYDEICEIEQVIIDITKPLYNNVLKNKVSYILDSGAAQNYNKLILLSKQILFFQMSDKINKEFLEVREVVCEFINNIDELNELISTKKDNKILVLSAAKKIEDQILYSKFDTLIDNIKITIKENIKI